MTSDSDPHASGHEAPELSALEYTLIKGTLEQTPGNSTPSVPECADRHSAEKAVQEHPKPPALPEQEPVKPRPAWGENDPKDPWCPPAIEQTFPECAEIQAGYLHNTSREIEQVAWRFQGATRRGRLHAHHGTHREDAFDWQEGRDFFVAAVSDGAGSSRLSRLGAEITVRQLTNQLRNWFLEESATLSCLKKCELERRVGAAMTGAIGRLLAYLTEEVAPVAQAQPKDFRCTLILLVWLRTPGTELLLSTQIGDGFLGARHLGVCRRYGKSDSGEFSGEVTCFIPDPQSTDFAQAALLSIPPEGIEALVLCTDGIEDPFYPPEKYLPLIFSELISGVREAGSNAASVSHRLPTVPPETKEPLAVEALTQWLSFEKRGENDDRTVVLIQRKETHAAGALESHSRLTATN